MEIGLRKERAVAAVPRVDSQVNGAPRRFGERSTARGSTIGTQDNLASPFVKGDLTKESETRLRARRNHLEFSDSEVQHSLL